MFPYPTCWSLLLCWLCCGPALLAQDSAAYVVIRDIRIEGNKHTRDRIILRELNFKPGDTIALEELPVRLEDSRQWVMNTGLFNEARVFLEGPAEAGMAVVSVREAWYIFPAPIFELVDRNIKVWWVQHNRSFRRMRIGGEFIHRNLTGNRDRLKVVAKFGYSEDFNLSYSFPYINAKQTLGLTAGGSFSQNREINYSNPGGTQAFFRHEERFIYQRWRGYFGLTFRPQREWWHGFYLQFHHNEVDPMVVSELNPHFFLDGRRQQRYFSLQYQLDFQKVDVQPYPWSGWRLALQARKDGLGIFTDRNGLTLNADIGTYLPVGERWGIALEAGGKLSLIRSRQPFNDNRALGFGRAYLYGYDLYVVDGLDMGYLRHRLRYRMVDFNLNFGKFMPIKAFRHMPVRMVGSINSSVGYVHEPHYRDYSDFNNQLLYGIGFGLDFIFFFDKVLRFEYSFNHLMENGLFLRLDLNI